MMPHITARLTPKAADPPAWDDGIVQVALLTFNGGYRWLLHSIFKTLPNVQLHLKRAQVVSHADLPEVCRAAFGCCMVEIVFD
jgi:hypothetical protein